ncbi:MAG: hypothetical protein ABSB19_00525 [Methylomonas sp.]|jgi:hypothetical protein
MSVAYYIVLDVEEPGFDTFVNGKAIAHALEELDALCLRNELPTLDSFMGQSMADFEDLLDEDIELPEDGEVEWFKPNDGIALIESIVSAIERNPDAISSADDVLEDLLEYNAVLKQAQGVNARWRLALDI